MGITLFLAGILAGLIQYLVDFKGLIIYNPPPQNAITNQSEPDYFSRLYNFIKDHWQFFGYILLGIAGAFLTPLINELTNNGLRGIETFKNIAEGKKVLPPDRWHYLILFGYGIVFGYSGVRIIRSIGSLVLERLSLKQTEQQKALEDAQKKIDDLNKRLAGSGTQPPPPPPPAPAPAALALMTQTAGFAAYFDENQNELDKRSYYASIDIDDPVTLFDQLHQLTETTHKTKLSYKPALHLYPVVDRYVDALLRSIYSGKPFTLEALLAMDAQVDKARSEAMASFSGLQLSAKEYTSRLEAIEDSLPYNCEHVVPQSWFDKKEPMRGDIHHLFTCEMKCNSFRSNHPYYDFPDYEKLIRDECGKLENNHFEPERNKGVVARAVLYFLLRYPGMIIEGMGYSLSDVPMLIKWHKENKPGLYEYHRNQVIFKIQGNRNPFIDFPELADRINFRKAFEVKAVESFTNDDENASVELKGKVEFDNCKVNPTPTPWEDWRRAVSLVTLLNQVNVLAPGRKKDSDGMIGDKAHQSRNSDHNPWVWDETRMIGVVTALDITADPNGQCDCEILAQSLQEKMDERIKYVIWNSQIMNSMPINGTPAWTWRPYGGSNPHTKHIHISVKCEEQFYDSNASWSIRIS